jgi:acetyl esterase/lipase
MVHGGAWFIGDKNNTNVWQNKLNYWGPKGYMLITVNYPMMNDGYKPDAQATEVARALTYIQQNAQSWGGNASKMVVMGHSAGAHLVSLVSVKRTSYENVQPWSGTILLDSAAYDLTAMMQGHPASFYKDAFGATPAYWTANSPLEQLTKKVEPLFLVCSSNRADSDCEQADVFKNKAISLGGTATLRAEALSHEEINTTLGLPGAYTEAVDGFITSVTE